MAGRIKNQKKKLLRVFLEYGTQIFLVIFISNLVVIFGFRYFLMASTDKDNKGADTISVEPAASASAIPVEDTVTPSPIDTTPEPSPQALGPILNLSFSMPGISSEGGNIKPLNITRPVDVFLYDPDSNSADKKVKPLFTIKTKVTYDSNPNSGTYTLFVNPYIDLGKDVVVDEYYQIAFKTPQALMKLIKDPKSKEAGGKIFRMSKFMPINIPVQELISGDIYPPQSNDDVMDISDYNMLVNCFGTKAYGSRCLSGSKADLDDNGVIDGLDYNIMLLSFRSLKDMGYPVPTIAPPNKIILTPILRNPLSNSKLPGSTDKKKPQATPTQIPVKKAPVNNFGGIIFFIIFIIIIGIAIFVALKLHLMDKFTGGSSKKSGQPAGNIADSTQAAVAAVENPVPSQEMPSASDSQPSASGATIFDNSQTAPPNIQNAPVNKPSAPAEPVQPPAGQIQPATASPGNSGGTIEKSGFLKKVTADSEKNGTWVTIADDSGITRGFYKGTNITDGFAKVKGMMKTDPENKSYLEISELTPEE